MKRAKKIPSKLLALTFKDHKDNIGFHFLGSIWQQLVQCYTELLKGDPNVTFWALYLTPLHFLTETFLNERDHCHGQGNEDQKIALCIMYVTGSDSCQIKSCQHKTLCGEGAMLWPTAMQMYNTGKLRFLSNGVSWGDALRVTKSGSYPSRGRAATVGNPGRQWCDDTSWQKQQIKNHVQQM